MFRITTRHLRRWEQAEQDAGRPCSRPYSIADLWQLYQRRYPKQWDRAEAGRLHLAPLLEQFDAMLGRTLEPTPPDENSTLTTLMLKCLASDEADHRTGTSGLPHPLRANLAHAAREQLREILQCAAARETLVRAYFEAALLAQAEPVRESTPLSA